jgi:hypothetical protein
MSAFWREDDRDLLGDAASGKDCMPVERTGPSPQPAEVCPGVVPCRRRRGDPHVDILAAGWLTAEVPAGDEPASGHCATMLAVRAAYRPPLGGRGMGPARAIMHHAAEVMIQSFTIHIQTAIMHTAASPHRRT